jgi:hypothetical protein
MKTLTGKKNSVVLKTSLKMMKISLLVMTKTSLLVMTKISLLVMTNSSMMTKKTFTEKKKNNS